MTNEDWPDDGSEESVGAADQKPLQVPFTTPQIQAHREGKLRPVPSSQSLREPVPCKNGSKHGQHVLLHLDVAVRGLECKIEFKISSPQGGWSLPVTREQIMKSITKADGPWAMPLETHNVRLDRKKLLDALHTLERQLGLPRVANT